MNHRLIRRAALLLTLAVVFAPVSAAQAATQQASGFRVIAQRCSWGQHWVSTDWGRPGLQSVATMDRSYAGYCDDTSWVAPAGHIAVGQNLIAWNDSSGTEYVCNEGPWIYNSGASHEVWTAYAFGRPCGGWYRGNGYAARYHNGWAGHEKPPVATGWVYVP